MKLNGAIFIIWTMSENGRKVNLFYYLGGRFSDQRDYAIGVCLAYNELWSKLE